MSEDLIQEHLDLLDAQRRAVFAALDGLSEEQIWQRPAPKDWCAGEILSHTVRFLDSFLPGLRFMWRFFGWFGRLRRKHPYAVEIENPYKRPNFPMRSGFMWAPRHKPEKPVPLEELKAEVEAVHGWLRSFYAGKDPDVLGNIYAYDPAIGVMNLITGLKVGIYHDQLHYDDLIEMAALFKDGEHESV